MKTQAFRCDVSHGAGLSPLLVCVVGVMTTEQLYQQAFGNMYIWQLLLSF
ncbi:MAG: hypothetical protein ACREIC_00430 [Limisphaerales bacterium]